MIFKFLPIGKNLKIILAKFINKISFAKIINSN